MENEPPLAAMPETNPAKNAPDCNQAFLHSSANVSPVCNSIWLLSAPGRAAAGVHVTFFFFHLGHSIAAAFFPASDISGLLIHTVRSRKRTGTARCSRANSTNLALLYSLPHVCGLVEAYIQITVEFKSSLRPGWNPKYQPCTGSEFCLTSGMLTRNERIFGITAIKPVLCVTLCHVD